MAQPDTVQHEKQQHTTRNKHNQGALNKATQATPSQGTARRATHTNTERRVVLIFVQDDPHEQSPHIAPGPSQGYNTPKTWLMAEQKRGSVLLTDGTSIHRGAGGPGSTMFSPFGPQTFRIPQLVLQPENVLNLMFVHLGIPEVVEEDEDPAATSTGSDSQPPVPSAP